MFEAITGKLSKVFSGLVQRNRLTEENIQEAMKEVRQALLDADVHFRVVRQFVDNVQTRAVGQALIQGVRPGEQIIKIVHDELLDLMGPKASPLEFSADGPTVIMVCGLQGSGKTTTCGKLALRLKTQGRQPMMVAADIQRPAAVEQLRVLGEQTGVPVYIDTSGAKPPEICRTAVRTGSAEGRNVILLDTAGRLHVDEPLMRELEEIARTAQPHQILLVCDSMLGQDAVNSAKAFNERLPIHGLILTKMDGDARGGAALSIKQVTGKPVKLIGTGEKLQDIDVFHPDRLVSRMLGMGDIVSLVEKAQATVDADVAQKLQKKLFTNQVSLQDLLVQLEQIEKMGSIKELLAMIPGMSSLMQQQDFDEGEIRRFKGIIYSMTRQERVHPEILDSSRKRRIAMGSGTTPQDINRLLKEYQMMRKMLGGMVKKKQFNPMALLSGDVPIKGRTKEKTRAMLREERRRKKKRRGR